MTESIDRTVAIVGAGLIGRSWAIVFSAAGWRVRISDPVEEARAAALELIAGGLRELARHGLVPDPDVAAGRVEMTRDLDAALAGAGFVQECGPENLPAKCEIFRELDAKASPETIIASSSSAICPSRFAETLLGRHRCLVGHPVNPPHLVPVVEVCGAPWTARPVLDEAIRIYSSIGQTPVTIKSEVEGFVLNRLQGALLAEAFRLVGDGVISPQDLDRTVKDGLGLRWSFMGPFETIDLNAPGGLEDYCRRYTGFYRTISADPAPPTVWDQDNVSQIVSQWKTPDDADARARHSAWRDRRLAALKAHKRGADAGV
ncbi:3-hydroxyacyl-CoA dehydrogenase [Manganibacter manganicus]|uniref:3-hydroxyacyl-CoA dehydrogenase n=1 Tax=Manganibacter manganicus TaxID=1873176 RepID=A0A1V8RS71_9HYPH|nr:3-hydroxyacyl-CoA dehydrogenase [Pseudaminobacter manganicus]OQM76061.1 3-hydroxyacyl-CoA dehydrogenase [Pseudaminobacter manganicus]